MKLSLYGNAPIMTPRDPQLPMEAANKQYVDNSILAHASDFSLHLTSAQNTFLDALTVTSTEVNYLSGVTSNVQSQLNSKLNLSGGTMTGLLTLSGNPSSTMHAATKQYVDNQDATKVSKAGDTMTGLLTLSGDPTANLHAATKQYVDSNISSHAGNLSLHLTPAQNTFLDALTVTSTEVNYLSGVTSNVQTQLDSKFDQSGGLITGDVTLDTGRTIYVSKVPSSGTEVVNKSYVDSLLSGQEWKDPVSDINLIEDQLSSPPATPATNAIYIIGPSPTGAWAGKAGYATYYNGTSWVFLQNGAVQAGDRFGVALTLSSEYIGSAGLLPHYGKIVTIVDATPGAIQYSSTDNTPGTTVLVFDPDSPNFGITYTYTDEGNWVPTNTSVNLTPGTGLSLSGNTLNINVGSGLETDVSNNLRVALSSTGSLQYSSDNLSIKLDGTTLTTSANGLKLSDSLNTQIADAVTKSGASTVTGSIVISSSGSLKSNVTPSTSNDVVTKGYVDTADSALQTQINSLQTTVSSLNSDPVTKTYVDTQVASKVSKAGDTMTGALTLSGNPTQALHAAPKQYVDSAVSTHAGDYTLHLTSAQNTFLDALTVTSTEVNYLSGVTSNVQTQLNSKLNLSGGTMTGLLTLSGDPTANLHAATKQYVDNQDATKVSKAGDTMTGLLTLSGDPTANLHAATKQYVDSSASTVTTYVNTQVATKVSKAGDTMTGFLTLSGDPTANLHAATKQYVDGSITTLTSYVNTQDNNLQSQINSLQTTVNTLNSDPVTKTYVDTQDSTKLSKSGGTMTGYIVLHADPSQAMHPATKQYVDSAIQGLSVKPSVRLATTTNLSAIYNNGTQGVNATLTGTSNGALALDGKTVNIGDRVLVKDQTNKYQNGDYVVQQVGDAGSPFILKRVSTVDESSEIPGSYFYVYDGNTLKGTGWVFTVTNPITFTIGTDDIFVNQFSGQGSIIAGNGLTLTGNTIDINTANSSRIVVNADSIDLAPTGVTPGTYTKVTVDGYGRATSGSNPNTLAGYGITDGQPLNAKLTSLSNLSGNGIVVYDSTNTMVAKTITVSGTGLSVTNGSGASTGNITIASNATDTNTAGTIVARDASGNFSAGTITANLSGNATTATTLQTARNFSISGDVTASAVSFNGSANVTLSATLANSGVTAGTYTKVTVDAKGRVTSGANPTTLAGYGITDAYTKSEVDTLIASLVAQINELRAALNNV
jgi:hypothetical protein